MVKIFLCLIVIHVLKRNPEFLCLAKIRLIFTEEKMLLSVYLLTLAAVMGWQRNELESWKKMKKQEENGSSCLCNDTQEIVKNSSAKTKTFNLNNSLVDSEEKKALFQVHLQITLANHPLEILMPLNQLHAHLQPLIHSKSSSKKKYQTDEKSNLMSLLTLQRRMTLLLQKAIEKPIVWRRIS